MGQHQTFKRSAEGKATTRHRRAMRAMKYATTDVSF